MEDHDDLPLKDFRSELPFSDDELAALRRDVMARIERERRPDRWWLGLFVRATMVAGALLLVLVVRVARHEDPSTPPAPAPGAAVTRSTPPQPTVPAARPAAAVPAALAVTPQPTTSTAVRQVLVAAEPSPRRPAASLARIPEPPAAAESVGCPGIKLPKSSSCLILTPNVNKTSGEV